MTHFSGNSLQKRERLDDVPCNATEDAPPFTDTALCEEVFFADDVLLAADGVQWQHWPLQPPTPQEDWHVNRAPAGQSTATRLQMLLCASNSAVQRSPDGQTWVLGDDELEVTLHRSGNCTQMIGGLELERDDAELLDREELLPVPRHTQHCPVQPLTPQTSWHESVCPSPQSTLTRWHWPLWSRAVQVLPSTHCWNADDELLLQSCGNSWQKMVTELLLALENGLPLESEDVRNDDELLELLDRDENELLPPMQTQHWPLQPLTPQTFLHSTLCPGAQSKMVWSHWLPERWTVQR